MKEMTLDEVKRLQLNILDVIDKFCSEFGIRYSMAYGTLLGAVRHKGYIPWDDDIDLIMPRPDYERFIHSFNGYSDDYYVLAPELNWDYYAPYANVCDKRTLLIEGISTHRGIEVGAKIDVFPVDGVPSDYREYLNEVTRMKFYSRALNHKRGSLRKIFTTSFGVYLRRLFFRIITCLMSYSDIQKKIHRLATSLSFEKKEYADVMVFNKYFPSRCKSSVFKETKRIQFEDREYEAILAYDEFLHTVYGDYMKLPPEDSRVNHHNFKVFWKDSI